MATKVIVAHHVSDFDEWLPVFKEHGDVRRKHGAQGHVVNRGIEDPNQIVIVTEFATLDGARGFMTDPSLKEAMAKAGVDGSPTIYLVEQAEEERY